MTTENTAQAAAEDVADAAAQAAAAEKTAKKEYNLSAIEVLGLASVVGMTLGFVTQLTINAFSSTPAPTDTNS